MDFEPYFKIYNLVSVHPKSIILSQMTNLNIFFDQSQHDLSCSGVEFID